MAAFLVKLPINGVCHRPIKITTLRIIKLGIFTGFYPNFFIPGIARNTRRDFIDKL